MIKPKSLNRDSLKALFSDGCLPDGENFASLIDSMINKEDDGISKDPENGLILSPENTDSGPLISFYGNLQDDNADWIIELGKGDKPTLSIAEPAVDKPVNRLLFTKDGNSGINTDMPLTTFHINGILGADCRVGTYRGLNNIPADGQWHEIITGVDDFSIFEIVAQVGTSVSDKHALLHTHIICRFNKAKIRSLQTYRGFCWNKLALRFRGKDNPRTIELKSRSNYGRGVDIKFHITKLWDNNINTLYS